MPAQPTDIWIAEPQVDKCRLAGRHRRQASSHSLIAGCQVGMAQLAGRHGSKLPRHRFNAVPTVMQVPLDHL
ncbi:hypothetical protein TX25_00265 [Pseudomonas lactis]|nr:hypothetical protein TX25_00265 [Pseudomonas lactis]